MNKRDLVDNMLSAGMSQTRVAELLKISRQRVNQITHAEKHKARATLTRAVKSGKVTKPSQCEECNSTGRIEAHHINYSQPLEITWLCTGCHNKKPRSYDPRFKRSPRNKDPNNRHRCLDCNSNFSTVTHRITCNN